MGGIEGGGGVRSGNVDGNGIDNFSNQLSPTVILLSLHTNRFKIVHFDANKTKQNSLKTCCDRSF